MIVASILTDVGDWLDEMSGRLVVPRRDPRRRAAGLGDPDRAQRDGRDHRWRRRRVRRPAPRAGDPAARARRVPRRQHRLPDRTPLQWAPRPVRRRDATRPAERLDVGGPTDPPSRRAAARHGAVHPRRPDGDHGDVAASLASRWPWFAHVDGDRRGDLGHLRRRARVHLRHAPSRTTTPSPSSSPSVRRWSITVVIEVVRHVRDEGRARERRIATEPHEASSRLLTAPTRDPMLAVVPVRDGVLPAGGDETVAECGGRALLAGSAP